jgi:hypothetical protein
MEHTCIDCGSPAIHTISDSIRSIFRMEQIFFRCGAVRTSSTVERWKASKVVHEGCTSNQRGDFPAGNDLFQREIHAGSRSSHSRHAHI